MEKAPDAFRTISEVAEDIDLPQHVLRFWETRFSQIKPLKRGGGRRYYRPDDVDLLKGIRYYLYGEGYTIKGVQRILKDRGIKHVAEMGRAQTENYAPPVATIPRADEEAARRARAAEWPEALPQPAAWNEQDHEAAYQDASHGAQAEISRREPSFGEENEVVALRGYEEQPHRAATASAPPSALPRDDIRRLQATLFELIECKRILDSALR